MLSDNSIAHKLLDETYNLPNNLTSLDEPSSTTPSNYDLIQYQENIINKNYNKETYLYDIIVISKLYGIIYRLFYFHYNKTLKKNNELFKNFIKNMIIKFTTSNSSNHITYNEITLNKLFDLSDLKLGTDAITDYNTSIFNIDQGIINVYNTNNDKYIPFYHYKKSDGTYGKLLLLSDFMSNDYSKINKLEIQNSSTSTTIITTDDSSFKITIYTADSQFTAFTLNDYYKSLLLLTGYTDNNNYRNQRIFLYLNEFNNILTGNDNIDTYLSNLKNKMYKYNIILYNSLIQYGLLNIKNKDLSDKYLTENNLNTDNFTNIYNIISSLNTFITSLTAYKELGYGGNSENFLKIDLLNRQRDDKSYFDGIQKGINELKNYLINLNIIETTNITITIQSKDYHFDNDIFNVKKFLKSIKDKVDIIKAINLSYSINIANGFKEPILIEFNFLTTIFVGANVPSGSILGIENGNEYPITLYNDALFLFRDYGIEAKIKLMQDTCNDIKDLITTYYDTINIYYNKKEIISNQYKNFNYNLNDIQNLNTNLADSNKYLEDQKQQQNENKTITYDKLDIKDKVDINDINNYILSFSDISSKYKNEWNIYNKGIYYYRILLIISIIIFIAIVIINNIIIDKNIIIYILIFIIILILTLILVIYKKPNKEHFYTGEGTSSTVSLPPPISDINKNSYIEYKSRYTDFVYFFTLSDYNQNDNQIKIAKIVLGSSSYKSSDYLNEDDEKLKKLDDVLNSKINKVNANDYINNYNKKLEYYKIKSIDLNNAIKVLKLTNIQNYYIILIIYITFVLVLLGIIVYYKYPDIFYSIIITISILFIIMIIIISIKIHKTCNSDNDIFYWSNLKPSLLNEND